MKTKALFLGLTVLIVFSGGCRQQGGDLSDVSNAYLDSWVVFKPSQAFSAGRAESAFGFEDVSPAAVDAWLARNRNLLTELEALPPPASFDEVVDWRLLERQARREIFRWEEAEAHLRDPLLYAELINHGLTPILVRQNLSAERRIEAVHRRLSDLASLAATARSNLVDGRPTGTDAAVRTIRSTADFLENGLLRALEIPEDSPNHESLLAEGARTASALRDLAEWLDNDLRPNLSLTDAFGEELYASRLGLTYGSDLTPSRLEEIAMVEIDTVRGLMAQRARAYREHSGEEDIPEDFDALIRPVLAGMELDNAGTQEAFLRQFLDLIERSEAFLVETDLVDLPARRTLFTALSPPHFAGASVGGVYSAGPFDPEAETLFYLPTIPDSAPEEARDGFYRSFNTSFNTMIITHEIYPGHYLQLKASASHESPIRALFTGDDFTEGWATFCERMTLDAGWDGGDEMTRLAHLRKRLENAVRAYVSVQVHCRGWGREDVGAFAVETGLLPPQFAENLWFRALFSPIQLPSYFVGYRQFTEMFEAEKRRLGDRFDIKSFNNAVIGSGGVPMDLLEEAVTTPSRPDTF